MEHIIYEYKVNSIIAKNNDILQEYLSNLAQDGWELVSVVEDKHYFKRPIGVDEYHINRSTGKYERKNLVGGINGY